MDTDKSINKYYTHTSNHIQQVLAGLDWTAAGHRGRLPTALRKQAAFFSLPAEPLRSFGPSKMARAFVSAGEVTKAHADHASAMSERSGEYITVGGVDPTSLPLVVGGAVSTRGGGWDAVSVSTGVTEPDGTRPTQVVQTATQVVQTATPSFPDPVLVGVMCVGWCDVLVGVMCVGWCDVCWLV